MRCTQGYIHKGVDSRGRGGYIIWWPAAGLDVLNADDLAPVPASIIAAVRKPEQKTSARPNLEITGAVERRLSGILEATARAQEGTRNAITFWSACRIADMCIAGEISDADAAYAALTTVSIHTGLSQRGGENHRFREKAVAMSNVIDFDLLASKAIRDAEKPRLIINYGDLPATAKELAGYIAAGDHFLSNGNCPVMIVTNDGMPRAIEVTSDCVRTIAHQLSRPCKLGPRASSSK
jgi:hypothetical protein